MRIEKSTLTWPRAARHILLAVLGVLFALQASAQTAVEEEDFSMLDKSWKEVALKLPAAPQDGNLLPIYVGPTATQRFALDSKSISVGKDGVVRYTVVSTSAGGAKNISFEGIRCDVRQKRLYAFGHADGSWSPSRRVNWEAIEINTVNNQHAVLASDYLCTDGLVSGTPTEMIEQIRRHGALRTPGHMEVATPGSHLN
jgi:hypothetical protein